MEEIESTTAPTASTRELWGRAGIAFGSTLALYVAPFSYYLTGCSSSDLVDHIVWAGLMMLALPFFFAGYFALGALAVFLTIFAMLDWMQFRRIAKVAIPSAFAAIVLGALIFGAVAPSSCSII